MFHNLSKLKFLLGLKSATLALFSSMGLLFGLLGVSIFTAFAYGSIIASNKAINSFISVMFKGELFMGFIVGFDDRLLKYTSVKFQKDTVLKTPKKLCFASESVQREVAKDDFEMLQHASEALQNDKEIALAALTRNSYIFHRLGEALQNDKEVVLAAVKRSGDALSYASVALRADKEVVLAAVKEGGGALGSASEALRNDKEVVLAAVTNCFYALRHASVALRADKEVVLAAMTSDSHALQYASVALRADKEVVLAALKESGNALWYASEALRADREVVLAAVKRRGDALWCASEALRADREVVLAAVTSCCGFFSTLSHASEALRNDKEVVLAAVKRDGDALEYASEALRADREVVLAAVKESATALSKASLSLQADKKLRVAALSRDISAFSAKCFEPILRRYPDLQLAIREFHQYSVAMLTRINRADGLLKLDLTEKEASQNMLVLLSSLPQQGSYEDRLNIICTVLEKPYIATNLAHIVLEDNPSYENSYPFAYLLPKRIKRLVDSIDKESFLAHIVLKNNPACKSISYRNYVRRFSYYIEFDYYIDEEYFLPQVSSLQGLQEFLKEQLQVLICKGNMPSGGGFDAFRLSFKESLESKSDLKDNVSKLLGLEPNAEGLLDKVDKLTNEGILDLLVDLDPDNLFSLKDRILSSNNEEIAASLHGSRGLQASP